VPVSTNTAISSAVESRFTILNDRGDDGIGGVVISAGNVTITAATSGAGAPFNYSSFSNSPTKGRIILHQPHVGPSPFNYLLVTVNAGTIAAAAGIFTYGESADDGIVGGETRGVTFDSDSEFQVLSAQRPILEIDYGETVITDVYILPIWSEDPLNGTTGTITPGAALCTGEFWT
ncbi:MAG: hypothetical protein KJO69_03190, partial [Gammaproteobacteria bacterium]|nr:hypothetical protein [Gammaproteobacteria bacterium]